MQDDKGCSSTASIQVHNNCPTQVYAPNAFTPNNDGVNDVFIPSALNVQNLTLRIYDRWGKLIFETSTIHTGWNGYDGQTPAMADVYVYQIEYTDIQGRPGALTGNVTLLR